MFKNRRFEDLKNWKQLEQVWDCANHSNMHARKIARSCACWTVGCTWQPHEVSWATHGSPCWGCGVRTPIGAAVGRTSDRWPLEDLFAKKGVFCIPNKCNLLVFLGWIKIVAIYFCKFYNICYCMIICHIE